MQQEKLTPNYKKYIFYLILGAFSYLVNFYYGSLGLYPVDSLSHFDTGYRIILGEYPFKDYWAISGPVIDYIQAFFFYFFGVSWISYVSHASIINLIISILIFNFFTKLNIGIFYSFFYALCFSILAYTSSGTPFVDHHSTFFSLAAIILIFFNFEKNSKILSILIPILFSLAFFSKQVPSSYIILFSIFLILVNIIFEKKFKIIKYYIFGIIISLLIIFLIGYFSGINLEDFILQYIYYPPTIGSTRMKDLSINFHNFFLEFKLIYFFLIPIILIEITKLFNNEKTFKKIEVYKFSLIILLVFSLIFHQLITQNQKFIFFLIPILAAVLHSQVKEFNSKKKFYIFLIIIFTFYSTQKYHFRFNEHRKFHELSNVDLKQNIDARVIDPRLSYLKWITPYLGDPSNEIEIVKASIDYINFSSNKLMVITNYSFFSSLTNKKLFSPIRWFVMNGNSHPEFENKYFNDYKKFLVRKIINNKISEILTIGIDNPVYIKNLLSQNCQIKEKIINSSITSHLLENCDMISDNDYKKS